MPGLCLVDPLPYLDFLQLMAEARCVLTDSGGIQEETTALGILCPTSATTPSAQSP
jgi:UDP-N-acetylglucosamine 2-epimerase (non-hydrolysing)